MAVRPPDQDVQAADSPGEGPRPTLVGRLSDDVRSRFREKPVQNLIVTGLVTVAVIGLGVGLSFVTRDDEPEDEGPVTFQAAMTELNSLDFERARHVAAEMRLRDDLPPKESGGPAYILGVCMAHDAENKATSAHERRALYLLAARYLEESRDKGFPVGCEGHGEFELGKSLHHSGQYADSVPALLSASESYPQQSGEIYRLLTSAYLNDSNPQLEPALKYNRLYTKTLPPDERDPALLVGARIEFELGNEAECQETLKNISKESEQYPEALLLQGRLLLREADRLRGAAMTGEELARVEALEKYQAALDIFRIAQDHRPSRSEIIRQAQYLLGKCMRQMGDNAAALNQLTRTNRSNFDTPEGMAAGLEVAELQHAKGDDEEALSTYRRLLLQAADMPVYSNQWVSLDELRERVEVTYRDYVNLNQFDNAIALADSLTSVFESDRATQLTADAHRSKAEHLEEQADELPRSSAEPLRQDARTHWRRAGKLYSELARLRYSTRMYADDLWSGAQSFLHGQDYLRAVRLLEGYLENQTRQNRPRALTSLGQAKLALNQPQESLKPLMECIEFHPRDPHSYRARLIATQAHLELGNVERAKELLTGNLEHESLTPRSIEWRKSLHALGRILHSEGLQHETQSRLNGITGTDPTRFKKGLRDMEKAHAAYREAIRNLSEAVARDEMIPGDRLPTETIEARYLIAEARRRSARLPREKLPTATIETTRLNLRRQIQEELTAAAEAYGELLDLLNDKQERLELSDVEMRILRNCYFARADALYDLGEYDEAIQAYSTATNRYQHEPESLEAYVQIANCHRQLDRPADARGTLEQAKVVLDRIRPEADFKRTTRYDREQWVQLLDWLSTL